MFVAAHLTCVCAGPALATAVTLGTASHVATTADPHACCHRSGLPAPAPRHAHACQHCNHAQLVAPDPLKLDGPQTTAAVLAAPTSMPLVPATGGHAIRHASGVPAPPDVRLRSIVLLL
jgi:hypothetical protein